MTAGPYRLSRNPMYLSLVVAYLGGTVLLASPWPFLTLLIPMGILDRVVIPYEEALMRGVFGKEYDAYRARVRRWL
jgi:protein-S-isoprenylcysteine O-methyltransferase Ste14